MLVLSSEPTLSGSKGPVITSHSQTHLPHSFEGTCTSLERDYLVSVIKRDHHHKSPARAWLRPTHI